MVTCRGVRYIVIDARYVASSKLWVYDIREASGDGEYVDQPEYLLRATECDELCNQLSVLLSRAQVDIADLSRNLHDAMNHVEHMLGCVSFSNAARDLDKLINEMGAVNSSRIYIENKIHKAMEVIDAQGNETEE